MTKRNYEIEFWRLIAALEVVVLHSYKIFGHKVFMPYGSMAVEFFLLLSGYFFAVSVFRDKREFSPLTIGRETWEFTWKKIKGFIYVFIIGFILCLIGTGIKNPRFFLSLKFPMSIFDFLMLAESGIPFHTVIGADWYLSAMLIAMFILYPIFRYKKEIFSYIISPILGIGILGILFMANGYVNKGASTSMIICTNNVLRAIAEICLGVVAYRFSEKLKQAKLSKIQIFLLSILDIASVCGAYATMYLMDDYDYQALIIFLFFLFIISSINSKDILL